jgi:hypothetical protein
MNLLGRLDKLLALANNAGATDEEARTAAREVCRLIGKHGLRIVEPNGTRPNPPRQPPRPTQPPPPKAEPLKWRKVRASRRVICNHCLKPINYGEVCAYAGKTVLDVDRAIHEHCFRGVYEK